LRAQWRRRRIFCSRRDTLKGALIQPGDRWLLPRKLRPPPRFPSARTQAATVPCRRRRGFAANIARPKDVPRRVGRVRATAVTRRVTMIEAGWLRSPEFAVSCASPRVQLAARGRGVSHNCCRSYLRRFASCRATWTRNRTRRCPCRKQSATSPAPRAARSK
jgi:hypothetical protein